MLAKRRVEAIMMSGGLWMPILWALKARRENEAREMEEEPGEFVGQRRTAHCALRDYKQKNFGFNQKNFGFNVDKLSKPQHTSVIPYCPLEHSMRTRFDDGHANAAVQHANKDQFKPFI